MIHTDCVSAENVSKLKKLEYFNLALNNIEVIENLEGDTDTDLLCFLWHLMLIVYLIFYTMLSFIIYACVCALPLRLLSLGEMFYITKISFIF